MLKLFTLFFGFSAVLHAQVQTTTGSGNFYNPLLWDCFCVPADGDSLVINHAMEMTAPIYYTSGQIKINASGSLLEDGSDRDVWVDGSGSLINAGTFNCHRLYISDVASFVNSGNTGNLDSLWNQATINNTGTISVYDYLNDETSVAHNDAGADLNIANNFNNQGHFINDGTIDLVNDFSNCNIQTLSALFVNNGTFCIAQDMTNCLDDTLTGTGTYHTANSSSNFGVFGGTFTFNTPTGSIGFNSGTIAPTVVFDNVPCGLTVAETENHFDIYPNPANTVLYVSESNLAYQVVDLSGKLIATGSTNSSGIDLSGMTPGIYTIRLQNQDGTIFIEKFVKH
ncbi:MAG: T9SS type A sorting domain-containing protein [Bacteroidetes bacterium]|nr:T9SS type A sorting domain-containing protein [Bacteroidota bacterium]